VLATVAVALFMSQAASADDRARLPIDVSTTAKTIAGLAPPAHAVMIPAGWFIMGTSARRAGIARAHDASETPSRRIWLDAFDIDRYEVTLGQYLGFLLNRARALPPDLAQAEQYEELAEYAGVMTGADAPPPRLLAVWPAFNVSWTNAEAYCRWKGQRLPSEAEWEKAARGTRGSLFPWGPTTATPRRAVFGRIYGMALPQVEPIESFGSGRSPYGLYHMAGNVAEWVQDWFDPTGYRTMPERNPHGPRTGQRKVFRGGGWDSPRELLRTASRVSAPPDHRSPSLGFRCARSRS
jgi:iron(II)-dependent oxidoreductase